MALTRRPLNRDTTTIIPDITISMMAASRMLPPAATRITIMIQHPPAGGTMVDLTGEAGIMAVAGILAAAGIIKKRRQTTLVAGG